MGDTWMRLTYKPDPSNTNRNQACGDPKKKTGNMAAHCAQVKRSLWPQAVQQAGKNAGGMQGWSESMSCDEFPCKYFPSSTPEPLLTCKLFSQFVSVYKMPSHDGIALY